MGAVPSIFRIQNCCGPNSIEPEQDHNEITVDLHMHNSEKPDTPNPVEELNYNVRVKRRGDAN